MSTGEETGPKIAIFRERNISGDITVHYFLLGFVLKDYNPEEENNQTSYQASAPQHNFDTPGQLFIPGKIMPRLHLCLSLYAIECCVDIVEKL